MTLDERGKRWMAYMDGQMSASEALEFERSLSPEDKKRLDEEVRLESAICERIAGDECCPEALWNALKAELTDEAPKIHRLQVWQRRFVGLAASIAIVMTSVFVYNEVRPDSQTVTAASSLEISEDSLEEFARHTAVPGTREATQQFLDSHNIPLQLVNMSNAGLDPHHPVKLLGACMGSCPKGSILELRISCCGKPIKLLVIKKSAGSENFVRRASRCGKVKESREVGGVMLALVGDVHGHVDLMNLLQPTPKKHLV
jgi:hypothetical protein